jgi:hypothetical protein
VNNLSSRDYVVLAQKEKQNLPPQQRQFSKFILFDLHNEREKQEEESIPEKFHTKALSGVESASRYAAVETESNFYGSVNF